MSKYLQEVIDEHKITASSETPASENLFVISDNSPPLPEDLREDFHRGVAQLLYAGVRARPDFLLLIIFLSSWVNIATYEDQKKLKRVMKYVKGTLDLGINIGPDKDGYLKIFTYADASYGVHKDMRSHTGIMVTLGSGPIISKSFKQKIE
jgi:hypothetical protein